MARRRMSGETQVEGKKKRRKERKIGRKVTQIYRRRKSDKRRREREMEMERLSTQASDASLPWQHRLSGLRGNG